MSSTVIDRARPAGHRAPPGSGFTGTLGLSAPAGLRRDRVVAAVGAAAAAVPLATVYIASVETVYPDRSRPRRGGRHYGQPGTARALYGFGLQRQPGVRSV